jgi:hypothetical protein
MTYNPFWIEPTATGLRAYFMPEDEVDCTSTRPTSAEPFALFVHADMSRKYDACRRRRRACVRPPSRKASSILLQLAQHRVVPGMAVGFEKATGAAGGRPEATGEMFAQVKAEKRIRRATSGGQARRTRTCRRRGGTARNLSISNLSQLHDWARRISEISKYQVAGVYGGILSLGYNTELADKRKRVPRCWKDLSTRVSRAR